MILSVVKIFQVSQHPRSGWALNIGTSRQFMDSLAPPPQKKKKNTENYDTKEMRDLKVDYD